MSAFAPYAHGQSTFTAHTSPIHTRRQSTSPLKKSYIPSPAPSTCSLSSRRTTSDIETSFTTSTSGGEGESDEEDHIFFGTPGEKEVALVNQLSIKKIGTPIHTPRSTRLQKRDSREFLRRQTILVAPTVDQQIGKKELSRKDKGKGKADSPPRKVWPGGFFERRDDAEESDGPDSPSSSNVSPNRAAMLSPTHAREECDLTLDFSRFRISETRPVHSSSPSRPSSTSRLSQESPPEPELEEDAGEGTDLERSWTEDELADSDKENCPAPMDLGAEAEEQDHTVETVPNLFEGPLQAGPSFIAMDSGIDVTAGLDLGGLRLADYDDVETLEQSYDPEEAQDDLSDSAEEDESCSDPFIAEVPAESLNPVLSLSSVPSSATASEDQVPAVLVDDFPATDPSPVPLSPPHDLDDQALEQLIPTMCEDGPTASPASPSSPLETARGGPVIIPKFVAALTSPIRDESPIRRSPTARRGSIPSFPLCSDANASDEAGTSDNEPSATYRTPDSSPYFTAPSRPLMHTPTLRSQMGLGGVQGKKVLKSTLAASIAPTTVEKLRIAASSTTRKLAVEEEAARSEAISQQLSKAFVGKLGMGPAQRGVNGGTGPQSRAGRSNGKGTCAGPTSTVKGREVAPLPVRRVAAAQAATSARLATAKPPMAKTALGTSRSTLILGSQNMQRPPSAASASSGSSASSRSTFDKPPTKPVSRPALAPRNLVQASAPHAQGRIPAPTRQTSGFGRPANRPGSGTTTLSSKIPVPTNRSSPVRPAAIANPLKRPLPFTQSHVARAAVSVTGAAAPVQSARSGLGLPARVVGQQVIPLVSTRVALSPPSAPAFTSMYAGTPVHFAPGSSIGGSFSAARPTRSPGRGLLGSAFRAVPGSARSAKMGTPMRLGALPPTPTRSTGRAQAPLRSAPLFEALGAGPKGVQSLNGSQERNDGAPSRDVSSVEPSTSSGPPATATRAASEGMEADGTSSSSLNSAKVRGSSEDHENVSFALDRASPAESDRSSPSRSPTKSKAKTRSPTRSEKDEVEADQIEPPITRSSSTESLNAAGRPKRATRPPKPPTALSRPASRTGAGAGPAQSIVPNMSEKELKAKTTMNTSKNEKRVCAIERQVVRIDAPRPPSPTSKIPTTQSKQEAEKKKSREARAKRRQTNDEDGNGTMSELEEQLVQRIERAKGPGDDEDWVEEDRPNKRAKVGEHNGGKGLSKGVKWDKGVVVIRDFGDGLRGWKGTSASIISASASGSSGLSLSDQGPRSEAVSGQQLKSALSARRQIELDQHGNVLSTRTKFTVKPQRVVVQAIFYEGEEPYVAPAQMTRGKKKSS